MRFTVRDFMFNPQGSLHGGIAASALDVSMGHLIHHETGKPGLTLEMKVQYMRPAMPGPVRCTGTLSQAGPERQFDGIPDDGRGGQAAFDGDRDLDDAEGMTPGTVASGF